MQNRQLGTSSLEVSPLCFGCNVFGWTADEEMSFRLLDGWLDAGFNFYDTADVYSRWHDGNEGGESETIMGKWLASRGGRDKIVLATKFGMDMGDGKVGLSPEYMVRAVEDSLRRLQTCRDIARSLPDTSAAWESSSTTGRQTAASALPMVQYS